VLLRGNEGMSLLEVDDLKTYFKTQEGTLKAVDGISFNLEEGQAMGLAGEAGGGKTTAALSIMKLLPANGYIAGGKINFMGQDMAKVTGDKLRAIRCGDISIIFQGAMNALNPVKRVGDQITEPILLHEKVDEATAEKRVKELFELVGINPARIREYPHEFSGGMRQRVMIAMALACRPKLVICDEPTTALDVMIQAQILQLLKNLQQELELAMIIISPLPTTKGRAEDAATERGHPPHPDYPASGLQVRRQVLHDPGRLQAGGAASDRGAPWPLRCMPFRETEG